MVGASLHGVGHVGIAHPPPGLGEIQNDVRLNAAIGDDAVNPVGGMQLLAQIGDADIHQRPRDRRRRARSCRGR
jgi:hypothetical protein